MVITTDQDAIAGWLCPRIGMPVEDIRCIGSTDAHGRLIGAVGYTDWMDKSVQMHCSGVGAWLTRPFLFAAFDYAFNVAGKAVVIGLVGSANFRALGLNARLGFKVDGRIEGAHKDGALVVMSMRKEECRWIKQKVKHGQEEDASTCNA
jgi:RimJ/RimL family protein N-acetyltransferase